MAPSCVNLVKRRCPSISDDDDDDDDESDEVVVENKYASHASSSMESSRNTSRWNRSWGDNTTDDDELPPPPPPPNGSVKASSKSEMEIFPGPRRTDCTGNAEDVDDEDEDSFKVGSPFLKTAVLGFAEMPLLAVKNGHRGTRT